MFAVRLNLSGSLSSLRSGSLSRIGSLNNLLLNGSENSSISFLNLLRQRISVCYEELDILLRQRISSYETFLKAILVGLLSLATTT